MRRKDKEVTDIMEIAKIIETCEIIHLGLVDHGIPYVVPLNFGYKIEGEQVTFFFHSALEGKKMDILRENPYVCFEMAGLYKIIKDEIPCEWTAKYESVMGYGDVSFVHGNEKCAAMDLIMKRYGYEEKPEYTPSVFSRTAVFKLEVKEITGKRSI